MILHSSTPLNALPSARLILIFVCSLFMIKSVEAQKLDGASNLALANNQFTFDTLKQAATSLKGIKNVNIILSPFNVAQVLSMIMLGAKGETFNQLSSTLHYSSNFKPIPTPLNQEGLHKAIADKLLTGPKDQKRNVTLETGNGIYPDKTFPLNPTFLKNVERFYQASVQNLDFRKESQKAVGIINADISKATNGKILDLLPPNSLDASTSLVLISTIYFKGDWKDKFDPKLTKKIPFKSDDGLIQEVDMMQGLKEGYYGDFDFSTSMDSSIKHPQSVKVLRLDYTDSNLAMFFLLPEQNGLEGLIIDINPSILAKLIADVRHNTKIKAILPKFSINYEVEMKDILQKLGITDVFSNKADLSEITKTPMDAEGLYISKVYHKAFIEVNEKGSEAAAATGVVISRSSIFLPITFQADRPFMYFIMDLSNSNILFIGTYSRPS
ncbi:unnamed protein product [Gordionus sp. m RMFG-2023]|uniref:leukocyte elastase inhibitor-like n=1 Tax=Gordionus sp. m RMFG-2023 TaxID=3053472 RepID=UPI0030DFA37C